MTNILKSALAGPDWTAGSSVSFNALLGGNSISYLIS